MPKCSMIACFRVKTVYTAAGLRSAALERAGAVAGSKSGDSRTRNTHIIAITESWIGAFVLTSGAQPQRCHLARHYRKPN